MKICWDNLENVIYTKKMNFRNRTSGITYVYKDSCKQCYEPFLSAAGRELFCNIKCSTIYYGIKRRGTHLSENTKDKLSKIALSKGGHSKKHCEAIRKGLRKEKHRSWKGGLKEKGLCGFEAYSIKLFADETRPNPDDLNVLQVRCAYCRKWFSPSTNQVNNRIRSINGRSTPGSEERFYCSKECKKECPVYRRRKYSANELNLNPLVRETQPELRQMVFERDNYTCQKCGVGHPLHCHHTEGIHWEPLESADIDKCITYCKKCHFEIHQKEGCNFDDLKCKK